MKQVKSCGFILFTGVGGSGASANAYGRLTPTPLVPQDENLSDPHKSFLLMKHLDRYDLPKGHLESGESDLECALREMNEETGIPISAVQIEPDFEYRSVYYPQSARFNHEVVEKTLIIFLGWIDSPTINISTEHLGYEWIDWQPPHQIQAQTIDPLLTAVSNYFGN